MPKILVVDDEPNMRLVIRTILETEGHDVEEAGDGAHALELVERSIPDVILLDLMMPRMDGWRFLEELRACGFRSRTRVVIISALGDEETIDRGRKAGAAHLMKPFDITGLLDAVNDALAEPPEELLSRKERIGELAAVLHVLETIDN